MMGILYKINHLRLLERSWCIPFLVGLAIRLWIGFFDTGFFAIDDMATIVEPSWYYATISNYEYDYVIRSSIIPQILALIFKVARWVGFDSFYAALPFFYMVLGAFSSLIIPILYKLGLCVGGKRVASLSAWLGSSYFLLAYIGSRAMVESLCIPFIGLGFYLIARLFCNYQKDLQLTHDYIYSIAAGIVFGLAAMIRLQTVILPVTIFVIFAIVKPTRKYTWSFLVGCLFVLLIQGTHDYFYRGQFLATHIEYLLHNVKVSSAYGVMPWFNYVLFLIALGLPPAVIYFLPTFFKAVRPLFYISAPVLMFICIHSVIGHKEERFMFPILPLLMLLIAWGDQHWGKSSISFLPVVRKYIWLFAVVINIVLLIIVGSNATQNNVIEPLLYLRQEAAVSGLAATKMYIPQPYGPQHIAYEQVEKVGRRFPSFTAMYNNWSHYYKNKPEPDYLLILELDWQWVQKELNTIGKQCFIRQRFEPSWVDYLLFSINPLGNRRRGPTLLLYCHD